MVTDEIYEFIKSVDRQKICILKCPKDHLVDCVTWLQGEGIHCINMGGELASFIESLEDLEYFSIDVYDYIQALLDGRKSKFKRSSNEVLSIYNLGILFEPLLKLNPIQLLKDYSKTAALIIIWEDIIEMSKILNWPTQKDKNYFNFTDVNINILNYEV